MEDRLTKIADLVSQQVELLQKLVDAQKKESPWLKMTSALGPIVSALLIAIVGWYFTSTYNQQQVSIAQIEAIEKLAPKLTDGTNEQRLAALASVLSLDSENLAIRTASAIAPADRTRLLSQLFATSVLSRDYDLMTRILKLTPAGGIELDPAGRTALQVAAENGDLRTTNFLIDNGFLVDEFGTSGTTALIEAARRGDLVMVELLLRRGARVALFDKSGNTALLVAIDQGHLDVVNVLLSYHSDLTFRGADGRDALLTAVGFSTWRFLNKGFPSGEIVKALLATGADPNSAAPSGQTAICEAVEQDYEDAAKALFDHGAKFTCGEGLESPLHVAAHFNRATIAKYFLDRGISPNLTTDSIVPLLEAREPEVASVLISAGANVNAKTDRGATIIATLVENPQFVGMKPSQERKALRDTEKGVQRTVEVLIKARADVNVASEYGRFPLEIASATYGPPLLNILLKAGARIDATGGEDRQTALMQAAFNCRWDNVDFLIRNKADASVMDQMGNTALDRALESANLRIKYGPTESSDFGTREDCEKTANLIRLTMKNSGVDSSSKDPKDPKDPGQKDPKDPKGSRTDEKDPGQTK